MSFHSYRVIFCAPIPTDGEGIRALRPCLSPYRDERQMNLSYMVLLDM